MSDMEVEVVARPRRGPGGRAESARVVPMPGAVPVERAKRRRDRRYNLQHWRRLRLRVLARDHWVCRVVPGCTTVATVADHVVPVAPGMPDALFFGLGNLRASCRAHNIARALAPELDGKVSSEPSAVVTRDYTR